MNVKKVFPDWARDKLTGTIKEIAGEFILNVLPDWEQEVPKEITTFKESIEKITALPTPSVEEEMEISNRFNAIPTIFQIGVPYPRVGKALFVVIAIEGLLAAEEEFADAVDLVGYWLEAIHSGNVEEFYDMLASGFYDELDMDDDLDEELVKLDDTADGNNTYESRCAIAEAAIEHMYKSLLYAYNIYKVQRLLHEHTIHTVKKIDNYSLLLIMVHR